MDITEKQKQVADILKTSSLPNVPKNSIETFVKGLSESTLDDVIRASAKVQKNQFLTESN